MTDTANLLVPLYVEGEIARTRRSGKECLIMSRWDNGSQMLYLIAMTDDPDGEPPRWVSGDMLRKK